MSLREVFIANLKKTRKRQKVSQMDLAERCDTAASYIGEIEIGRKFPSIEMIEKIAGALNIEAYRLFVDEESQRIHNDAVIAYFENLPPEIRREAIDSIMAAIGDGLLKTLRPENEHTGKPQRLSHTGKGDPLENSRERKK
ncbi:MAG: helix-turn-helix transcriptional regulator [Treponema sp.]|jgi:transcriptional regulator with XRE-family HTH domain|nr:helix-turn-helix transcriptional regulator [Treponema sp.]